ncbi:permease [Corynebacterium comes]|uniref:Permease n=1 Tax=Corynebacterium comes TaxID=2675218 RepID=A0A6B8W006_9CORY|nr:permease [Corynebacterium comes]QGU05317.1 putative permease [Corynebacterium comes]
MNLIGEALDFLQRQVLGMAWLNQVVGEGLAAVGLDPATRIGASVQFFIYDLIKISALLCVLIFAVSYLQSYFPPERSRRILSRFRGLRANTVGALLGTVTPFCSCSSIPIFMGFSAAGLPLGVTFSFLISSPMVDLASLVLLASIFGFRTAFAYVILGLLVAVVGGTIIEKLRMESHVAQFAAPVIPAPVAAGSGAGAGPGGGPGQVVEDEPTLSRRERTDYAVQQTRETFVSVIPYILIGVGVGAVIHNWIPASWVETALGSNNPFGVIIATLLGAPMYADIFGTLPVAEALLGKGAQLGTILAFMMATTTLSLPSMIMLRRVISGRLLAVFIGICLVGIIIVGYFFNLTQHLLI